VTAHEGLATVALVALTTLAQAQEQSPPPPVVPAAPPIVSIPDGTPVRLRLMQALSTAQAHKKPEKATLHTGDTFPLEVMEEVRVRGHVAMRAGARAQGTVTEILPRQHMGKEGKLTFTVDWVEAVDGTKVGLRAQRDAGGSGRGAGDVATRMLFGFGGFMRGKDVSFPMGQEVAAFVQGSPEVQISMTP